ncbi:MAG TPA: rhodanese-like domain-containing protein [Saprospiraceae bacterium]|nr:rhodanese-like domain-containing protein [Saprospiraceae bacterium]
MNYIIAAAAILLFSLGLIFLPEKINKKELEPENLLLDLQSEKRFISVDQMTERIINGDPTLVLVDVRDSMAFGAFSLPNAINIPLEEVLAEKYNNYFDREELDVVFFSNDDFLAEKAWLIKKRQKPNPLYILKGGLNQWTSDILLAEAPKGSLSEQEMEVYAFRAAAKKYFVGASREIQIDPEKSISPPPRKKITVLPKKVEKKRKLEGC